MKRLGLFLIAFATAVANYFVFVWVANAFHLDNPEFLASILILAIVIHEVGHMIVLEHYGVKTYMFFAVILGGVGPQKAYVEKFKNLPWGQVSAVALAGVMGNVLMVVASLLLYSLGYVSGEEFSRIANLNGLLIFWNLIPFGMLDGGRVAKALFDSIPENEDGKYVLMFRVTILIGAIILLAFNAANVIIAAYAFFFAIRHKANNDDPNGSYSEKAMTKSQYEKWAMIYLILFLAGLALGAIFPDWLNLQKNL